MEEFEEAGNMSDDGARRVKVCRASPELSSRVTVLPDVRGRPSMVSQRIDAVQVRLI